jgi:transposase InsO family protein
MSVDERKAEGQEPAGREDAGQRAADAPVPEEAGHAVPDEPWIVEGAVESAAAADRARKGRFHTLVKADVPPVNREPAKADPASAEWRLLILDSWTRTGLPAQDFVAMLGGIISKHTLYQWKRKFIAHGPAGLEDMSRDWPKRQRLAEATKRAILMLKETHPEWGIQRISDSLLRGPGLSACPMSVSRVLHEAGYASVEEETRPHGVEPKRFERSTPNELWQSDIFTFVLKRQNRRLHLVAIMDDHSRFILSYGLHASASGSFVIEAMRAAVGMFGPPKEMLTDNGTQYHTWRGKSAFRKELERHGVVQIVAAPHRPQTLGKIERFWGTLWNECISSAIYLDMEDARKRIGLFIDHYNFQRPHQGIEGLVPADRFFGAASDVLATLKSRVASNALALAMHGLPRKPFYMTGQVAGKSFSVHAEGERVILQKDGMPRQEVELVAPDGPPTKLPDPVCPEGVVGSLPGEPAEKPPLRPGESGLDQGLKNLSEALGGEGNVE